MYHIIYISPEDGRIHGDTVSREKLIELLQGGAEIDTLARVKPDKPSWRSRFARAVSQ